MEHYRANSLNSLKKQISDKLNKIPDTQSNENIIWEEKPVSPETFIRSLDFYGDEREQLVWPWIYSTMNEVFSGEDYKNIYNIVNIIGAIGIGKSTFVALLLDYLIYRLHCYSNPYKYFGLIESTIAILNLAPRAPQAKSIVFDKVVKAINRTQWFRDKKYLFDPSIQSELKFRQKGIVITPGSSSENFPLGADLYGGIIDEAQHFLTSLSDPAELLFDSLNDRRISRFGANEGIIILISDANIETSFQERLADEGQAGSNKVLNIRRAIWEAKPKKFFSGQTFTYTATREKLNGEIQKYILNIPLEYKESFEHNPRKALKTLAAIPSLTIEPYIEDWDKILNNVNRNRQDPIPDTGADNAEGPLEIYRRLPDSFRGKPEIKYNCHVDLAKGGVGLCKAGLAISHRGPDRVKENRTLSTCVIDLVTRFKAEQGKEVDFGEVRQFIFNLIDNRGFKFEKITFDRWQSIDSVQTFKGMGINADTHGCNYVTCETAKTMMYEGRVDYYYREVTFQEMKRLELKDKKVEHALGSTDDEWVCFARVIEMVTENIIAESENKHKKRPKTRGCLAPSVNSRGRGMSGMQANKTGIPELDSMLDNLTKN